MIKSSRSERGWRGRRRIAVLVSVIGVFGVFYLGSTGSASAALVANCNAKLEPKGKSETSAKLSFVCDNTIRAFGVGATGKIKNYGTPSAGAATGFLSCEGFGAGFGCGVSDRAAPGTQPPGTTGWTSPVPPYPGATADPLTCGGFKRIASGPNRNGIVGVPCTQLIPAGTKVTQSIKLGASPCGTNPLQPYLFVGGEPPVTSIVAGTELDTTTVGEYISPPIRVNMKAYKGCQGSTEGRKAAKKSGAPATKFPVNCQGLVEPQVAGVANADVKYVFTCDRNIRAFALYSNKVIDLPSEEPSVSGTNGGGFNESALHQCEGDVPGPGFGCGIVDRQTQSATLPNGSGISAGNTAEGKFGFEFAPCKKKGEPKPKVWMVAMGEPVIGGSVGEFISQPIQLAISGYGKCKGGKKK